MKNAWGDEVADSASTSTANTNSWGDPIQSAPQGLASPMDLLKFAGRQIARVSTAPISGGVQAIQDDLAAGRDPELISTVKGVLRGVKNPNAVQSYSQGLQRMGAPNQPSPISRTIGYIPGVTPNGDQTIPGSGMADMLGTAGEMATPIPGLGLVGDVLKTGTKIAATGAEDFGLQAARASLKPSKALRRSPIPFDEKNLFKAYPDAPKGLASPMGKKATLSNIQDFHEKLNEKTDAILESMPKVNLLDAVNSTRKDIQTAMDNGLHQADEAQINKALDLWEKSAAKLTENKKYSWLDNPDAVDGRTAKNWRSSLSDAARYDKPETNDGARLVAASIREALNAQIAGLSPELRAIDKQFAETIPLRNALADAVGREGNKYPVGIRTAIMLANPASLASEAAKVALIEGTSRYAPAVAIKKTGSLLNKAADFPSKVPGKINALKAMRQIQQDSTGGQQ